MAAPLLPILLLGGAAALALGLSGDKKPAAKPGAAPTSGTYEFDPNLPPVLEAQALGAIKLGTAAELDTFAAQLDGMGYHMTAAALRKRSAELRAQQQQGPGPSADVPTPADVPPMPGTVPGMTPIIVPPPPGGGPAPGPFPVPSMPAVPGVTGLDPGMDQQTAQAVIAAITSENDPAKLQGFASSIMQKYPVAAGLLWAKATALIAAQAPAPGTTTETPVPGFPAVVVPAAPPPPLAPPPGVIQPSGGPTPPAAPPPGYAWRLASDADVAADGVQPRLQALLSQPVGTEVQETHAGHLWKFRVISNQTDPSLTTFAKDVKGWIARLVQGVLPGPTPAPTPAVLSVLQGTARAMNLALLAHGYKQADQPIYQAFQRAAGLGADGFPGRTTMGHLQSVLAGMGTVIAPVRVYPWRSMPGLTGYDGTNAPTQAEWLGTMPMAAVRPPSAVVPAALPAVMAPVIPIPAAVPAALPAAPFVVTTNQDVQRALNALGYKGANGQPLVVDGAIGANSQFAVRQFQAASGLKVDGMPGPQTKGALSAALAAHGVAA
jgi:hypothetical protein